LAKLTRFKITAGQGKNGTGATVEVDGGPTAAAAAYNPEPVRGTPTGLDARAVVGAGRAILCSGW
jgi:hypothetical protein